METVTGAQQLFFQHIKNNLPAHLSFVDEIAEQLNISVDSAYRRIRGEKPISFEEMRKLCSQYKISLDQFLHLQSDSFLFTGKLANGTDGFFDEWLKDLLQKLTFIKGFEKKHLYYLTKDIPFVSFFQVPELATFKFFVWMKTFLHYEEMVGKKLSLKNSYSQLDEIRKKIVQIYNNIPSTEIWNMESINTTILQIEFYREANMFESKDDAIILYNKLEDLINHFEQQAETGKKFTIGESPRNDSPDYQMFHNELFIGDNTVLVDLGVTKASFLNHSVIHFVFTLDERFCNYVHKAMQNMIRKSTQISTVGEKSRIRFFNELREKIAVRKDAITHHP